MNRAPAALCHRFDHLGTYDEIVYLRVFGQNVTSVISVKDKRLQTLLDFVTTLGKRPKSNMSKNQIRLHYQNVTLEVNKSVTESDCHRIQ